MANEFNKIIIGGSGLVGSGVANKAVEVVNYPITDWTSALVQLVIAVATIFGLFRKRSKV